MNTKSRTLKGQKKGEMEIEEIVKIVIAVIILFVLAGATIFLLNGKGSGLLQSIKNALRFG